MSDLFDIDLFEDSSPAEIQHQIDRLRRNPMWKEAVEDKMHPSNKTARRVLELLANAKHDAMEAARFVPTDTLPSVMTPEKGREDAQQADGRPQVPHVLPRHRSPAERDRHTSRGTANALGTVAD